MFGPEHLSRVRLKLMTSANAAERIEVDYESLPCVTDTEAAADPNAPLVWNEAPSQ